MTRKRYAIPWSSLGTLLLVLVFASGALADVKRKKFVATDAYLVVEVLRNDLIHCEVGSGTGPDENAQIYTSPMVFTTIYPGPTAAEYRQQGDVIETADLRIDVNANTLACTVRDKTRGNALLTTICPVDLNKAKKGIDIDPGNIRQVYGLGQELKRPGSADGDWISLGVREGSNKNDAEVGNGFPEFVGGKVGNVQIPVMYAVGDRTLNYALFLDNVYWQRWDFGVTWWQVRMYGDQIRYYVMSGKTLVNLRSNFMELTGRPPVPPRKAFGLWVSEYGYHDWTKIDSLRDGLRHDHFPVDGFVLDLTWFGGVTKDPDNNSRMGRLNWDQQQGDGNDYFFPEPGEKIRQYANDHIGLAVIEESYLAKTSLDDTFNAMPGDLVAQKDQRPDDEIVSIDFWGKGRMIDWSNSNAGIWIHENRRYPNLVQKGISVHWTDLGEPECFDKDAYYYGVEPSSAGRKNRHCDIHNLYNLLWNQSIWDGYVSKQGVANDLGDINCRPLILTRSGSAGTQRFGTAMWSGDIGSQLAALATHCNAQMHMSFSGIDYYGADAGGFRREALPGNDKEGRYTGYENELYAQWFANACWFDVPLRPHTDNEFVTADHRYNTAPNLIGHKLSNLVNLRQRYELIPYYYSLAYEAWLGGQPLVPPLVFYYQDDPRVRGLGNEKLIGKDMLVAVVACHGQYDRHVYLPAGAWINYHTNEWHDGGRDVENVPVYRDGLFRLPVFVRAGAILPQMHIDEFTKDVFGHRTDGRTPAGDLIVKVYAAPEPSCFTLYEDDGKSLSYDNSRPRYDYRATKISQQQQGQSVTVTIAGTTNEGGLSSFPGVGINRTNLVRLVVRDAQATEVQFDGVLLPQYSSEVAFESAQSGWCNVGSNLILAKSPPHDVNVAKSFTFTLTAVQPVTSMYFVCQNGRTQAGTSVYVVGSIPQLGNWNVANAVRLDPSVYYQYVVDGRNDVPVQGVPIWTAVVSDLPPATEFEWKFVRRREDGSGQPEYEPGVNHHDRTGPSGYSGRVLGGF